MNGPLTSVEARRLIWSDRHPIERAAERYELDLTTADLDEMARTIEAREPRAVPLLRGRDGAELYAFHLGGEWAAAVWHPNRRRVVTFPPAARLDPYRAYLATLDPATGLPMPEPVAPISPPPNPPGTAKRAARAAWIAEFEALAAAAGIADPSDLAAIGAAFNEVIVGLARRLDYDMTDRERAARNFASLLKHAERKYAYSEYRAAKGRTTEVKP